MKVSEGFMLRVLNGEFRGKVFPLRDSIDIGSAGECELCISDSLVSPSHARLQKEGDEVVVEDLGSSRGTFLNERPVDRASLRTGDLLRVGGTRLSVIPDTGSAGGGSPGASGADRALLRRAKAAEVKKVELEKARARLTRQNEELGQKLAQRLDQKKRLVAGLKSVMAARGRLESQLEEARDELSRVEAGQPAEPGRPRARDGKLQKELEAVQSELAEQAENHQQQLADSMESLQAAQQEVQDLQVKLGEAEVAQQEVQDLQVKLGEAEAGQADVSSLLLEETGKLTESVSGQAELSRRLESSDSELEKEREITIGLRAELAGLRSELDSLLAERKQDSHHHRSELASQEEENRKRLEETEQDLGSAYRKNIKSLQAEKERMTAELKVSRAELEKQAAQLAEALAESDSGRQSALRMQEELEQERNDGAGFRLRCGEIEKELEQLSSGTTELQQTMDTQAAALARSEEKYRKVNRELAFYGREREKAEKRLQREIELLQGRLVAAEKKRRDQEAQLDGLRDSESSRSEELVLLRKYADDVRQRLLEKEALLEDLGARLLLEGAGGAALVDGGGRAVP